MKVYSMTAYIKANVCVCAHIYTCLYVQGAFVVFACMCICTHRYISVYGH